MNENSVPTSSASLSTRLPRNSLGLKLLLVCFLALLMAIPTLFVWGLVSSRTGDAERAISEVAETRGGEQTVLGPVLVVPYKQIVDVSEKDLQEGQPRKTESQLGLYYFFAETGKVSAVQTSEMLSRGLNKVPVYEASIQFLADFNLNEQTRKISSDTTLDWENAKLVLGVSDLRGVSSQTYIEVEGERIRLAPDSASNILDKYSYSDRYQLELMSGTSENTNFGPDSKFSVVGQLTTSGAQRLGIVPFAQDTDLAVKGDWKSPKFEGAYLPKQRDVSDQGFSAQWQVSYIARGIAGSIKDINMSNLSGTDMAVTLLNDASPYRSVIRALKYSPMIIGLVFLTYFLFEAARKRRAHPAQYVLVGLAQAVFYLLLLGLSEHLGFGLGFGLAATATVALLSLNLWAVFGNRQDAVIGFATFASLYAAIFVLMRLDDYALLVGSIASFIAIGVTMWMTRNIRWYGEDPDFN